MLRPARPTYRIFSCLLALLLFAQMGIAGFARAAQPGWIEICSAAGSRYVPAAPPESGPAAGQHYEDSHCAACPAWQVPGLPPTPPRLVFAAALAGMAEPPPAPPARATRHWPPQLARGPPLPA